MSLVKISCVEATKQTIINWAHSQQTSSWQHCCWYNYDKCHITWPALSSVSPCKWHHLCHIALSLSIWM